MSAQLPFVSISKALDERTALTSHQIQANIKRQSLSRGFLGHTPIRANRANAPRNSLLDTSISHTTSVAPKRATAVPQSVQKRPTTMSRVPASLNASIMHDITSSHNTSLTQPHQFNTSLHNTSIFSTLSTTTTQHKPIMSTTLETANRVFQAIQTLSAPLTTGPQQHVLHSSVPILTDRGFLRNLTPHTGHSGLLGDLNLYRPSLFTYGKRKQPYQLRDIEKIQGDASSPMIGSVAPQISTVGLGDDDGLETQHFKPRARAAEAGFHATHDDQPLVSLSSGGEIAASASTLKINPNPFTMPSSSKPALKMNFDPLPVDPVAQKVDPVSLRAKLDAKKAALLDAKKSVATSPATFSFQTSASKVDVTSTVIKPGTPVLKSIPAAPASSKKQLAPIDRICTDCGNDYEDFDHSSCDDTSSPYEGGDSGAKPATTTTTSTTSSFSFGGFGPTSASATPAVTTPTPAFSLESSAPKVDEKKDAPASSFSFGVSTANEKKDSIPASSTSPVPPLSFSFGASTAKVDEKKNTSVPSFSFAAPTLAATAEEKKVDSTPLSFSFGSSSTPAPLTADKPTIPTPAATSTSTSTSAFVASKKKLAPIDRICTDCGNDYEDFDHSSCDDTSSPYEGGDSGAKPAVVPTTTSPPSFSFGASSATASAVAPSFSFGGFGSTNTDGVKDTAPAPSFSFGKTSPTKSEEKKDLPVLSFSFGASTQAAPTPLSTEKPAEEPIAAVASTAAASKKKLAPIDRICTDCGNDYEDFDHSSCDDTSSPYEGGDSGAKPAVVPTDTSASATPAVTTPAPSFSFGGFGASSTSTSTPAPSFSFGASTTKTEESAPPAPSFSFGVPSSTADDGKSRKSVTFGSEIATTFNSTDVSTKITPAAAAPAFGSNTTMSAPAFGANSSTVTSPPPSFGVTPSTSAFGTSSTTITPAPAFAANSSSAFGVGPSAPAFGANSTSTPPAPFAPAFGANSTTPGPAFGANSTASTFGAAPSASAFGATPSASAFGAAPSASAFGAAPSASAFGAAPSASAFGVSSTSAPAFGTNAAATPAPSFSFGANTQTAPAFGTVSAPSTFGTAPFGANTAPAPAFGVTPTPSTAFGTTPAPAFSQQASTGAFGSAPTPSFSFGGSQPTPTPAFGAHSAQSFGANQAFGSATSTSSFGANNNAAFNSNASFGQPPQQPGQTTRRVTTLRKKQQ